MRWRVQSMSNPLMPEQFVKVYGRWGEEGVSGSPFTLLHSLSRLSNAVESRIAIQPAQTHSEHAMKQLTATSQSNWRAKRLKIARIRSKVKAAAQNTPKLRAPLYSKSAFLRALKGSGGIKARIADKLKCDRGTIDNLLNRPDWEDVRSAYITEVDETADIAEQSIRDAMEDDSDRAVATLNARWYLSKVRRERFGDDRTVTVQGGDKPIQTVNANLNVDIASLKLPLDTKKQILKAMEDAQLDIIDVAALPGQT